MASSTRGAALRQIGRLFEGGTVNGLTDRQLLERYVDRRDETAFAALVDRHGPMVLGACRSILKNAAEVEDAFQATFLVLIRKAGSVRGHDALGPWLHRVACRIAVQAAADIARRRLLERRAGELAAMKTDIAEFPDDLRAILHEEVDRLPENLRLALVVCDLDGLGRADAAQQLGWTEGELRGRLSRARRRLRDRLLKRGLAVTAGLLVEALGRESSAAVPRPWVDALARAAVAFPAGQIVATGSISATAAKMAQATLATMFAAQAKAIVTASAFLIGLGMLGMHLIPTGSVRAGDDKSTFPSDPPSHPRRLPPSPVKKPEPERERETPVPIVGRVFDPSGKPLAGAVIHCYRVLPTKHKDPDGRTTPHAVTDAEGRFRVVDSGLRGVRGLTIWGKTAVAASAEGYGPAWTLVGTVDEAKDVTLKVVKDDIPIVGHVLDLEGRPIRGVRVSPSTIYAVPGEDLSAWEKGLPRAKDASEAMLKWAQPLDWTTGPPIKTLDLSRFGSTIPAAMTDDQGRFRLTGIGRERIASLLIQGSTIFSSSGEVHARTRPGPTYRLPNVRGQAQMGYTVYHGPTFDFVASPTRPIVGTVRDKETGKPLAGISIRNDDTGVRTTSNAQGHYRLVGLPRNVRRNIVATPPTGLPYLEREMGRNGKIPASPGDGPALLDIALRRGMTIRGKVTDHATGKPVFAYVDYFAFPENPHIDDAQNMPYHDSQASDGVLTHADGSYELVGLPGRGLVAIRALDGQYLKGQGSEKVIKAGTPDSMALLQTAPGPCLPRFLTAVSPIDPPEAAESIVCDVVLDPGRTISGRVEDPEGRPVKGILALDLLSQASIADRMKLDSDGFTAFALDPAKPRRLFFHHSARKLAGTAMARGDEKESLVVRLKPAAAIVGRLLDEDRHPVSDAHIQASPDMPFTPLLDESGRFRIECLATGIARSIICRRSGGNSFNDIASGIILEPGETRDLGDIVLKPAKSQ